jgi:hypothetical protein
MKVTVTPDVFKLARAFTISRGSRTEAKVLTVRIEKTGLWGGANVCLMPAMMKRWTA